MDLKVGDKVFIKHPSGFVSHHTPQWCLSWTGTIVRLNSQTVAPIFYDYLSFFTKTCLTNGLTNVCPGSRS